MANRDCWRRIVPFFFFFLVGEKKVLESFEEGFVFLQFLIRPEIKAVLCEIILVIRRCEEDLQIKVLERLNVPMSKSAIVENFFRVPISRDEIILISWTTTMEKLNNFGDYIGGGR